MHWLVLEPTQKYESSHPRPCRNIDISWDCLQFLCIGLCRSLLKSMSCPIPDHAEKIILAEMVFNFYAFFYAGDCSKVSVILSHSMQKDWFWMRRSSISIDHLCWIMIKGMRYPFSEHAESLILAEVFNFYAFACAGASSNLWAILSQRMQKGWC